MSHLKEINLTGNRILAMLPPAELAYLQPHLEPVRLAQGKTLYAAGEVIKYNYFLVDGLVSLLSVTEDGAAVEVGMIGDEGMAGVASILRANISPYQVVVQITAHALRINQRIVRAEFDRGRRLQELLLRYVHTLLAQVSQSAACNSFHTVEARLCRWLLIGHDRAHTDELRLTQEFLSHMIGAPRTSVTAVAGALQSKGLINYRRGKIWILDRPRLEATSCECYRMVKRETSRAYAA